MSILDGIHLVEWSAETDAGRRFMDTSTHTVNGEVLAQGVTYSFKVIAPPGLHPDELLSAIRGAKVTAVVESAPALGAAHEKLLDMKQTLKEKDEFLTKQVQKVLALEKELKRVRLESGKREQEDKDNKARLDALALLGTTVDVQGLDKLIQTELNTWLRGLDDFNMTGGEAKELREMLTRLAKECFARGEVLRDRPRCAVLLESVQREGDRKTRTATTEVKDDEDQLF